MKLGQAEEALKKSAPHQVVFPDRSCQVAGCETGLDVSGVWDRQLCLEHLLLFRSQEESPEACKRRLAAWIQQAGRKAAP